MAVPVVPGFAFKTKTRPATTRAAPSFLGFRRPRSLWVGPAIATLAWEAHFRTPTPPTRNSSSRQCRTTRSAELSGFYPNPSISAPPSSQVRGAARSQHPKYAGSTLGCESHRLAPPPPGPALVPAPLPRQLCRRHRRT
ncbi:hypothetical protein mRhiFer1_007946 [Rhinolophus ferrumequinum]|uniref:Uncharacterized protein n=1 Tax=Rhinolophus ferrumequinum TaxID=59479 RepID=A0A7J8AVS7_RHIFE|nr:hypothetical protein mRhiFer1_007946 [Rhinolophus ferrumequinum]